jgi:predicted nucleic acid-binding protein
VGDEISAVADAGPIIHLNEVGCLPFLRVFNVLHIPDAVWAETVEQVRVSSDAVRRLGIVQRHSLPQAEITEFTGKQNLHALHQGERECLYLCKHISVPTLLTDDLAVRDTAKRLSLIAVGSLGIIAKAYRLGHVSLADAEKHMMSLYDVSSLFVTRTIVDLAIEELRKSTQAQPRK